MTARRRMRFRVNLMPGFIAGPTPLKLRTTVPVTTAIINGLNQLSPGRLWRKVANAAIPGANYSPGKGESALAVCGNW